MNRLCSLKVWKTLPTMRPGEISTDILLQQQCSTLGKFQFYRAGWEVRVFLMVTCGGMLRLFYDYFFLFKNLSHEQIDHTVKRLRMQHFAQFSRFCEK